MAKRTFLVDIDLSNNQLLQARFENLASDPAGTIGRVYYNTTLNQPKYFNGTTWVTIETGGSAPNASETVRGILELATTAEASAGTDDTTAITPLKLRQTLGTTGTVSNARKFSQLIGDGSAVSIAVTHNLGNTAVIAQVVRVASPFDVVECEMVVASANIVNFNFNVAPTSGQFRVTIIG